MACIGDSVAVSGVCLTVIDLHEESLFADLAAEIWERTSFSRLDAGAAINLELPMKVSGRFGGHLVQGHVEYVGEFRSLSPAAGGQDFLLQVEAPPEAKRSVVTKGSIAIEGISLTVAKLVGNIVTVAVIPHTLKSTNLRSLKAGDPVNIETDVMSSYLAKWTTERWSGEPQSLGASISASELRYAVVVGEFNSFITDQLLRGALQTLKSHQVPSSHITVARVPGAYEIPITSSLLARSGNFDAIICLGCLIRGGTLHYEVIAHEVSRGIGQSALESGVPHSFGVITCDTQEQAIDRAGLKAGNKVSEAALAAMRMASLKDQLISDVAKTPAENTCLAEFGGAP